MIQIEGLQIRRSWIVVGGVLVLLLLVFFLLEHLLNADTYRGEIESSLSQSLGRQVKLGELSYSLFTGSLVAATPSIADDPRFSTQPFLTAKRIRIAVETGPLLFHRELHIQGLTIEEPKITLLRAPNGTWNYSSLGGQTQPGATSAGSNNLLPDLTVARMKITGGTLSIGTTPPRAPAHIYTDLNLSAENFAMNKAFPFTADGKLPDGGTATIRGTAGPINPQDASLTPLNAQVSLQHADLLAAGFVEPQQGIAGLADLDAKVVSNGQSADATGKLHLTQLKLAKNGAPSSVPVDVQFSVAEDPRTLSGSISNANIAIGSAQLALTGTYQSSGGVRTLQLHASGDKMPVDALVAFLPSLGVQLPAGSTLRGGVMSATLDITGPVDAPVISGPVRITGAQLAGFDLGQKLASIQALTGAKTGGDTTIQVLEATLHYGPDGIRTDNLAVVVGGLGSASGSGSISPAGALDYHLLVKPDASGVAGVAAQAAAILPGLLGQAVGRTTKSGIPLSISGTISNPVFTPDVGRMLGGAPAANQQQPANSLGTVLGGLLGH